MRLRVVEYLLAVGWPRTRISTEESVGTFADSDLRTDIICYDRQFQRKLLIECKAEQISITDRTAEQVARYNQMVEAPYLMMTNGLSDYWYRLEEEGVQQLPEPPGFMEGDLSALDDAYEQWQQYGFAGEQSGPSLKQWLGQMLPRLWSSPESRYASYLNFNPSPTDVPISHYYRLHELSNGRRLALTTLNTPRGESRLIAILNESGQNRAVLEVRLDELFDGVPDNSILFSDAGEERFDLADHFELKEMDTPGALFNHIAEVF